jgi:ubiquitin carboxyl-terminal hydrolase 9/24
MLMLLVELVAERVKRDPIPVGVMGVLTIVGTHTDLMHTVNARTHTHTHTPRHME